MSVALIDRLVDPGGFSLQLVPYQRGSSSPYGGSMQVVDLLQDYWTATVSVPPMLEDDAAELEAWINGMRGMTQVANLHHLARPWPRGTLAGSPTAAASAAVGAASISINTTAGATLRSGDMLGVGGMLLQVALDCVANGAGLLVVPIVNRLRKAVSSGAAVTWDRPTAAFRLITPVSVLYTPGYAEGVTLDFMEDVTL